MESGASAVGTSELRSTSLQPGRSWWAVSVLRRRLPICIVARSGAVACAPDRTSRLFRAVKKSQKEKSPQDSLGWLGGGGVEPPACEERGINPRRSADGLPPHMRSWRSALPFRCLVAGCGVEPPPWGLRPDAAGSRPYMPGGCAGRYSGIALFVDFDGFLLRFFAVLPVEFH